MIKMKTQTHLLLPTTSSGYFRTESAQLLAAPKEALPGLELGWSPELSYTQGLQGTSPVSQVMG